MALLEARSPDSAAGAAGPGVVAAVRALRTENPFVDEARTAAVRGANMYGFCSVEDFPPGITDLSATHEDAGGFYNYVNQFTAPNFWYRDGGVLSWIYGEQYDNWQGTYGFDACTVEYHSGHGDMDANGVFWMPMGGTWGGASWVSSQDMRLGNEVARYLFLSTCLSLRVGGGNSPIKTWYDSNLGLRMIFGFETVSVDSPDYGSKFFQKWNSNGNKLSKAWLDASWDISNNQAPSAVGMGATQAEAQNRVFNETNFYTGAAAKNWWWWTWYDAARSVSRRDVALPDSARSVRFAPVDNSPAQLIGLAERYGIQLNTAPEVGEHGVVLGAEQGPTLVVDQRGVREIILAEADGGGRDAPNAEEAVRIASQAVETFGLAADIDLVPDKVRHNCHAGASRDETVEPRVRETHVVFTQVIDGQPLVTPGIGEVRVSIDGAGTVTSIVDATRSVDEMSDFSPPSPQEPRMNGRGPRDASSTVEELLEVPTQRLLGRLAASGRVPTSVRPVADSTDVGFAMRGSEGVPVVRREVEVDCGEGLAKRYIIEALLR
jgi:hypothetical protein